MTLFIITRDKLGYWIEYAGLDRMIRTLGPFESREKASRTALRRGWQQL